MVYFSGHAKTLFPLFVAFGENRVVKPAPGSAIFMEFFEQDGKDYVKTFYKASWDAAEEVFGYPGLTVQDQLDDGSVSIEDFENFVSDKLG